MQNDMEYYSMMGLLKKDTLGGIYHEGAWYKFHGLGDVLQKMEKYESGDEDKHSIPDVYGRPFQLRITMESMMVKSEIEKNYLLTKELLAWRGILTAIALQDFLDLKMKVDVVNYKDEEKAFDKALKYPPKSNIFSSAGNWGDRIFHIITLKGDENNSYSDIAMFSPLTVVYPVADLEMPKVEKLKWFDYQRREFINPASEGILTPTEKLVVCFWIQHLKNILAQDGDSQESDIIRYHLEAYENELTKELTGNELARKNCFEIVEYDKESTNIISYEVVKKVLNSTVKVWVLLDESNKIEYKELFAEQIYYVDKADNPFIGCNYSSCHKITKASNWYALLPLSKKVCEKSNKSIIDALMRNFSMEAVKDTSEEFKYIHVKLQLSAVSNVNVDAEKKYYIANSEEVVHEKSDMPVIALWPGINMPEWGQYYIYVAGGDNGRILLNMKNNRAGSNHYVESVKDYPNAIALKRSKEGKEYDIGMIIPEYVEHTETQASRANITAVVGIDFGTSGTTVYTKIYGDNTLMPITIRKNAAKLLTTANEADLTMMNKYFVMQDDNNSNRLEDVRNSAQFTKPERLYSIYLRSADELLDNVEPILDGIIYQAGENEMTEGLKRFMPNIKWENPNNGTYYKAFIEELCLHVWEELRGYNVTAINWRYALPISIRDSHSFHEMWRNDIYEFLNQNITTIGHDIDSRNYTESEAASQYFLSSGEIKDVNPEKGYMIVDIGGGSTDIAVWQKQNSKISMVAQTSVPVAGRYMFNRWVELSLDQISNYVFPKDDIVKRQLSQLKNTGDINIINAVLERIVNHNNIKIMKSYKQDAEWAAKLKRQLEFGVALLFFSLGSMVGHLRKNDTLKDQGDGNFGIALGGNGSKILDWMTMDAKYQKLLDMFKEGIRSREMTSYPCNPQIIRSRNPKEEVAQGLIQDGWENIEPSTKDIGEFITDECAIMWNNVFINKYNEKFRQRIIIDEDAIRNLMSNVERTTDVCNFFMQYMYCNYYIDIIGALK